jgi:hypothetical protein
VCEDVGINTNALLCRFIPLPGAVVGFVGKDHVHKALASAPPGTFVLRFSDSAVGGITVSWVAARADGSTSVMHLQPWYAKVSRLPYVEGFFCLFESWMVAGVSQYPSVSLLFCQPFLVYDMILLSPIITIAQTLPLEQAGCV